MSDDILGRIAGWCQADPKLTFVEEGPAVEVAGDPPLRLDLAVTGEEVLLRHGLSLPRVGEGAAAQAMSMLNRRGSLLRGGAEAAGDGLAASIEYPLYLDGLTRQNFLLAAQEVAGAADAIAGLGTPSPSVAPEAAAVVEPAAAITPTPEVAPEPMVVVEPAASVAPAKVVADTIEMPAAAAAQAVAGFVATHEVPPPGMSAWARPDPSLQPVAHLEARVQLRVEERRGAWARVTGSNGWSGWVDDRRLIPRGEAPTMAATPAITAARAAAIPVATAPVITAQQPAVWQATHQVPAGGLPAWAGPDPAMAPVATLAARTQLRLEETRGAWARVTGSNGWSGWVDGRRLAGLTGSYAAAGAGAAPSGSRLAFNPFLLAGGILAILAVFMVWTSWDFVGTHFWDSPPDLTALLIGLAALMAAFGARQASAAVGFLGAAVFGGFISIVARNAPTLGDFFKYTKSGWLLMAGALLLLIGGLFSAARRD